MKSNKDKKPIIALAASFAFVAVVLVVVLLFMGKDKDVAELQQLTTSAQNDDIDFQRLAETAWGDSKGEEDPEFLKKLDEKSSFSFSACEQIEDGYYIITFDVISPDINAAMKTLDSEMDISLLTSEEIGAKFCEIIDSAEMLTSSQTAIVIVDEEGIAHIKFTQGFVNAMYGYVYNDAFESLANVLS